MNTPSQNAAIVTDYLLTVVSRVALMNAKEAQAFKDHLSKTALSFEQRDRLLSALGL